MTEKYKPNGTPLTPYERGLLTILQEECAEVIQAASKLLRFGKENRPGSDVSNSRALALEIGDLREMINRTIDAQLVSFVEIAEGHDMKRERLAKYMQNEP